MQLKFLYKHILISRIVAWITGRGIVLGHVDHGDLGHCGGHCYPGIQLAAGRIIFKGLEQLGWVSLYLQLAVKQNTSRGNWYADSLRSLGCT
jgi:hypothetical protein